jgi:hypothetical protein
MSRQASRKVTVLGLPFDSKLEAARYRFLLKAEEAGIISELEARKEYLWYLLQESRKLPANALRPKAETLPAISYTPDFRYLLNGIWVVEDVKGKYGKSKRNIKLKRVGKPIVTEVSRLRHKLYQAMFPHVVFRLVVDPELDPISTEGYF